MTNLIHKSVMLDECIEGLNLKDGGIYFDGTLGGGGHSYEILAKGGSNSKLIATDLDTYAIERATERLKEFGDRFTLINDNFKNFLQIKEQIGVDGFDGILLDLGVSSFQLDDRERGFSYLAKDVDLDMRMDKKNPLDAKTVINKYEKSQLQKILSEYGEEKFASQIASNIVKEREKKPIEKIGELISIIEKSIPKKFQNDGHPAKRTFQAIRIEVNDELDGLYQTVLDMARSLNKGGRIVILTFHSLEDRIVKKAFKELECNCICDKSLPVCVCGKRKEVEILTKHPIVAGEQELEFNSRAKSAKLRIAEKV